MSLFSARLKYDLNNVLEDIDKNVEIEARFRNISERAFIRLQQFFSQSDYKESSSFSTDYYTESGRINERNNKYFLMKKKELFSRIIRQNDKDLKISIATESKEVETEKPLNYTLKRVKDRTSYNKDNYRIDLTKVEENDEKRYELELEIIDNKEFDIDNFENKILDIYKLLEDPCPRVVAFFNKIIAGKDSSDVKDSIPCLSRARDLLIPDLTKNGLMKNYSVSPKADGEQKLLIFLDNGIWLYYPYKNKRETSLIRLDDIDDFEDLKDSIFTGEYVSKDNFRDQLILADYLYLPFDTLAFRGKNVTSEDYNIRKSYLNSIYKEKLSNVLILEKKSLFYKHNANDFHTTMRDIFEIEQNAVYLTDGLIFTPIDSGYITAGQKLPIKDKKLRILKDYPDVCKYKKIENLTVDFLVKEDGLHTLEGLFKGIKNKPFTKENYKIPNKEKYLNKIVEFEPRKVNDLIFYYPRRIRTDKDKPNRCNVVIDNWKLQHDPVEEETLKGESIQLMRKYHNQIKKNIINNLTGYVIDIGSGAGGDISKFVSNKKIKKILSIEPDLNLTKEFNIRMKKLDISEALFNLKITGGENSDLILEEAKKIFPLDFGNNSLTISFFISLSFFFSKEKDSLLDKLVETIRKIEELYIKRKGKAEFSIVYLTIEGSRLTKLFKEKGDNIKLNNIILRKISSNEVYIDIIGSVTVSEQKEYIVDLDKLWKKLNYQVVYQKEADNEDPAGYILSKEELTYSKLFVYGMAKKSMAKKSMAKKEITLNEKCLEVNEKKAISTKDGIFAKGDDSRKAVDKIKGLYRLAVMSSNSKLYHSLLKLMSSSYRNGDVFKRHAMSKDLKEKVNSSQDLSYLSDKLKHGIKVINSDEHYGKEKECHIILYKCEDGQFEPVVFKDGKTHFIFSDKSYLLR